jgi:hypothetical protein
MLYNVENWNGQNIPAINKDDVVKLRRVFPYNWITTDFNEERDNWKLILFNNLKLSSYPSTSHTYLLHVSFLKLGI